MSDGAALRPFLAAGPENVLVLVDLEYELHQVNVAWLRVSCRPFEKVSCHALLLERLM